MANVNAAIDYVLGWEDATLSGAITTAPDGKRTRFGIDEHWHPELTNCLFYSSMGQVAALQIARGIYDVSYCQPLCIAEIASQDVANKLLSLGVNIGVMNAARLLQDAVTVVGDEEGLASLGHVVGPCLHHFGHGRFFARCCVDTTVLAVPVDGARYVARPEVVESMALGWVTLSQIVRERPEVAWIAGHERFERAAWADRPELAVIPYRDQLRSRGLHSTQQFADVGVRCHRALVQDQDMPWAEHFPAVLDAPGERGHCSGANAGAFSESLGCLARSGSAEDLVTGGLETFPHGRKSARLARPGNSDHQVQRVPRSEEPLSDFGLFRCETEASGKLCATDRRR